MLFIIVFQSAKFKIQNKHIYRDLQVHLEGRGPLSQLGQSGMVQTHPPLQVHSVPPLLVQLNSMLDPGLAERTCNNEMIY